MQNSYSIWKYLLLLGLIVFGLLYSAPNFYGEDPAVQVSAKGSLQITPATEAQVKLALKTDSLSYLSIAQVKDSLLIRFASTDEQLKARDAIKKALGKKYVVALNLAARTPQWLKALGAAPMKLGLDLRGGVHFLLDVDVSAVLDARMQGDMRNMTEELRDANVRYAGIVRKPPHTILIFFRDSDNANAADTKLSSRFPNYVFRAVTVNGRSALQAVMTDAAVQKADNFAIDQTITVLTKRVNELGVAEAAIQRQGRTQVSVDLPGIQDTARAKDLIGKTATLKFQLADTTHDAYAAKQSGAPIGTHLYKYEGRSVLLKNQVILRGSSVTYATQAFGQDGRPSVNVRLGGGGEARFNRITAENVGKPLAVVYVESHAEQQKIGGKMVTVRRQTETVISVATIQSALGANFEITGLESVKYAQNLALLLRSGALAAPVNIIQERTVGPSLGKENIHRGLMSMAVGSLLVILFMAFYYRLFGFVADMALMLNIVFIVAILSVLGATLTLPGIAGIVLTVGMAVDANVLINERVREDLRLGMSPHAAIVSGYERAFMTIVDANVTTLIVMVILFSLGTASIKGFAVTVTIGLITSMITAIFFTRAVINLVYGRRNVKKLSIGIKQKG